MILGTPSPSKCYLLFVFYFDPKHSKQTYFFNVIKLFTLFTVTLITIFSYSVNSCFEFLFFFSFLFEILKF